jgi:hypothetical protein
MTEEEQSKHIAYAIIRHTEECESKVELIEAVISGKVHG